MFAISSALFVMLSLPAAAPADQQPDAKAELAKWQGTWEVEFQVFDGKEKPAKDATIAKVVIKGDVWQVHFKDSDKPVEGKITLVLDGKVKGIDVAVGDSVVVRSVYLIDGDRVLLNAGDVNGDRPKDFSTSVGRASGGIMIYKRVKK